MPTTNPVPSTDPGDLLYNAQKLDEVVTGTADSYTDRLGVSRLTLTGAMRLLGYEAPVAFASGLNITRASQTVTNGGNTYHANPASLPFTTTATFNASQWRVINNITYADMTGYAIPMAGATDLTASFKTTGTWSGARLEVDANFAASISGGAPTITLDAGDAISFNRTTNTLDINIGGSRMTVSPTDGPERATDASTANGLVRKSQADSIATTAAASAATSSASAVEAKVPGISQTWQNVTASRVAGTTYYNATSRPIFVAVSAATASGDSSVSITVSGSIVVTQVVRGPYAQGAAASVMVPPGAGYSASATASISTWFELR